MTSLSTNFRVFLSNIEPTAARKATAQDMPAKVRDYLQKHEELATVFPHSRLAGSYRRRTANGEIKDVDVLVFVSNDYEDDIEGLLKLLHSVLLDLPEELDDCGDVTLRKQRRSIGVHLEDHDLFLDIVPVRFTTDKTTDVLLVPDREWSEWVETQPLGYAEFLSTLNGDHEDKVVPLVKMFKHWRNKHFERRRPKSYWLESLIVRHINCDYVLTEGKGYGEIVADLFDSIYTRWEKTWKETTNVPEIPDAMLGNDVAWNWERSHFKTFMLRIQDCKGWARRAVEEKDESKAVELWQKVFGLDFPVSSVAEATVKGWELGEASKNGNAWVSATGLVSAASSIGTQAPPTRFYGDQTEHNSGGRSGRCFAPKKRSQFKKQKGEASSVSSALSLPQHIVAMQRLFPGFVLVHGRRGPFWRGELQPQENSPRYRVRVEWHTPRSARVFVESPTVPHQSPHHYRDGSLCLHYPKDGSWTPEVLIAETIVPWTAQWLVFYELWLVTGKWFGPEAPHGRREARLGKKR